MIGFDTSAVIDLFKGEEGLKNFFKKNKEPLAASIMTYLELYFGLDPENPKHQLEGKYYDEFFKNLYSVGLTEASCKEASRIFWELKKEGKEINKFDCVMASIFLTNGIKKILTKNAKDFKKIRGLSVINY
jgi:predicted nucleic acid-binding protein